MPIYSFTEYYLIEKFMYELWRRYLMSIMTLELIPENRELHKNLLKKFVCFFSVDFQTSIIAVDEPIKLTHPLQLFYDWQPADENLWNGLCQRLLIFKRTLCPAGWEGGIYVDKCRFLKKFARVKERVEPRSDLAFCRSDRLRDLCGKSCRTEYNITTHGATDGRYRSGLNSLVAYEPWGNSSLSCMRLLFWDDFVFERLQAVKQQSQL